jgi:hypothetical protein
MVAELRVKVQSASLTVVEELVLNDKLDLMSGVAMLVNGRRRVNREATRGWRCPSAVSWEWRRW